MINILKVWFNKYFSDPEAVLLFVVLLIGFGLIFFLGSILGPLLASIIFAYLLDGIVQQLQRCKLPHLAAVIIVFVTFISLVFASVILLLPLLWKQLVMLFNDLPIMQAKGQALLDQFITNYPDIFSQEQIKTFSNDMLLEARNFGKIILTASWSSLTGIVIWMVYLILVPVLVFFFLKDKKKLLNWFARFLPTKRGVLNKVFKEVNGQIGNYIRGKIFEIFIVTVAIYLLLWYFHVQYAFLLSFLVGLSSLIPFIGGIVATIPLLIVAYLQFGWTWHFGNLMIAYTILLQLDANLLVPVLFSEAVNLHPVAIVIAILFFGSIWGFWGVFFAIPLATLVKAVINAWPKAMPNQYPSVV